MARTMGAPVRQDVAVDLPDVAELRALAESFATEAGRLVRDGRPERVEVAATKSSAVDPLDRKSVV